MIQDKKKTNDKVISKDKSPTLREQWNKSGGTADIPKTTRLLNQICHKINLD